MTLRAPGPAPTGADPRLAEASRALESMLLKRIVSASGAFSGGDSAGSSVRADLFATTLADAVSSAGGLGIADQLTRSLTPGGGASPGGAQGPRQESTPSPLAHVPSSRVAPRTSAQPGNPLDNALEAMGLPVAGRLTSGFGARIDPLSGEHSDHPGLDLGAPEGTPIRAPAGGIVRSAGPRGGYGNAVEIDHGNGLVTLYGHASELLVSSGEFVQAGQEIATVGTTGRSTGPHLHFEVRQGGRVVDPGRLLKKYLRRADGSSGSGP